MTVILARISEAVNPETAFRVVTVYTGQDRDHLALAGNLVLRKEEAELMVAVLDGQDEHEIDIERHGWIVKHPLQCRVDLLSCGANGHGLASGEDGRFSLRQDSRGYWELGERLK